MDNKPIILNITLIIVIISLFSGVGLQPAIATVELDEETIDVKPKDYLFQTIIDITNNQDVKELIELSGNELFKVEIDRSVFRKLLLRNPRLMFNMLFNKPSMSIEYLNKCYNQGIEVTNILGEDNVIEIVESVEITDIKSFVEFNNIISKDEELSSRLETLKEMNIEINYNTPFWENYPIICSILLPVLFISFGSWIIWDTIMYKFGQDSIIYYLILPFTLVSMGLFFATYMFMVFGLQCVYYYE